VTWSSILTQISCAFSFACAAAGALPHSRRGPRRRRRRHLHVRRPARGCGPAARPCSGRVRWDLRLPDQPSRWRPGSRPTRPGIPSAADGCVGGSGGGGERGGGAGIRRDAGVPRRCCRSYPPNSLGI
jgi:hypothetical protein